MPRPKRSQVVHRPRLPDPSTSNLNSAEFHSQSYAQKLAQIEELEKYRRHVEKQEEFDRLRGPGSDARTLVSL